jgi:hypothetical protein
MEGQTPREAAQDGRTSAGAKRWRWPDTGSLVVLLLLAAGVRTWLFCHTEVAARDSIGFIRIAWQFEHQPWKKVLKGAEQHPGYPLLLLAVSKPVRYFRPGPDALVMQYSAQLASVLAATLLVVPMFYLGRELFSRTAGFWGSVLFQLLPASSRVLSDGLSEATFLLFAATALYLAVRALRVRSPALFGLCGVFGALAYLTRPEGALIVGATAVVLLAAQVVPAWRRSWPNFALSAAGLALAASVVGSPIYLATKRLTTKPTGSNVMKEMGAALDGGEDGVRDGREAGTREAPGGALAAGEPAFAALLAVWVVDPQGPHQYGRVVWGLWAIGYEVNKGFHYAGWLSALLGLWWFRGRLRQVPGAWVLLLLCLAVVALLWRVATLMGYLSDRHTLLLILCGSYWAAAALAALAGRLALLLRSWLPAALARLGPAALGRLVLAALLGGLVGSALPKSLEPPHLSRDGFHAAGLWLAQHAQATDEIFDPYCWSSYYAGRMFHDPVPPPRGFQATEFVVVDESGNQHPHLSKHEEARRLAQQRGTEVYRSKGGRRKESFNIAIYAVQPPEPQKGPRP